MKTFNYLNILFSLLVVFTTIDTVYSQNIVCTFDTNDEGWTVIDNDGSGNYGKNGATQYYSTDGNPGGHIEIEDNLSGPFYGVAPAKFLGDLSSYINGNISFDARAVSGDVDITTERAKFGLVTITGAWGTASLDIADTIPSPTYGRFEGSLSAAAWGLTESDWAQLMSNVTSITILLEYSTAPKGDDRIAIDNVTVAPKEYCTSYACETGKVQICHKVSSRCDKYETVCVDQATAITYLSQGDSCGPCAGYNDDEYGDDEEEDHDGDDDHDGSSCYNSEDHHDGGKSNNHEESDDDDDDKTITVYPNPFNKDVTFDFSDLEKCEYEECEIIIYSSSYNIVIDVKNSSAEEVKVSCSSLAKGYYTYKIIQDNVVIGSGTLQKKK